MTIALGAIVGYLLGSISVARIVASRVVPDEDDWITTYEVGEDYSTTADGLSPGAVGMRAGPRYGGLSTLGDMAKAALAVGLAWWLLGREAAAAAGAGAVVGHIWPVYHRFKGAFGLSPIIGASLVLSPLAAPFAVVAGALAAWVVVDISVMTVFWPLFLVVWGWLFSDPAFVWFAAVANGAYLVRMWPQIRQRIDYRRTERPGVARRAREILAGYRSNPFA
jgi:glycerol-3-phosphate acyltransferase PlsY